MIEEWEVQSNEASREATLWVGPDGTDNAEGTYENPLASIQTAIDRLDDKFGTSTTKQVLLKSGVYEENVFINTRNLILRGHTASIMSTEDVIIKPDDYSRPPVTITNMTRNGYENFEADGGLSANWDRDENGYSDLSTYSYTGASLNREFRYEGANFDIFAGIRLESLILENDDARVDVPASLQMMCAPNDNGEAALMGIRFKDIQLEDTSFTQNTKMLFAKNVYRVHHTGVDSNTMNDHSTVLYDTASWLSFNEGEKACHVNGEFVIAGDDGTDPEEGGLGFTPQPITRRWGYDLSVDGEFAIVGDSRVMHSTGDGPSGDVTIGTTGHTQLDSTQPMGDPNHRINIEAGHLDSRGSGHIRAKYLRCVSGEHEGTGRLMVEVLKTIKGGNFTIRDGTNHRIGGGTVDGDLIIEQGSEVSLHGLVVKGDLVIRDSGTQVDCEGCHVQGAFQLETTIDTQQNFYGGSIVGEGHTNEIRDENGNDQSGSSNWNRVSGV